MDRDVVGAAASIFIVSSIKVPNHTNELISTEMNHELPDQRINAILRFQVSSCHPKNDLICFFLYLCTCDLWSRTFYSKLRNFQPIYF